MSDSSQAAAPQSISEYLHRTGSRFRIYDLGRRIVRIPDAQFEAFEAGELPWPQPLQQQAWLAVLGWNPERAEEQFVWFLKFPLDEMGKLNPAARDGFLAQLIEQALLSREQEGEMEDALSESAYGYKPRQEVMAVFHAKASRTLGLPPSQYAEHAQSYFRGEPGWDQWAFVGMQGIADLCARLDQDDNEALLTAALPHLPATPLMVLCSCLEHESFGTALAEALARRLRTAAAEGDAGLAVGLLRGLSYAQAAGLRRELLGELLGGPMASEVELLAAVVGRCWEDLKEPALMSAFLEAAASNPMGQEAFTALVADLMMIPGMRVPVLEHLRDPQRSAALATAVEGMFKTSEI